VIRSSFLLLTFMLLSVSTSEELLSDEDIFNTNEFDSSIAKSAAIDSSNSLKYLPGITFLMQTATTVMDSLHYSADTRFYGMAFVKASKNDIGALYLGCTFNYFLYGASDNMRQKEIYSQMLSDNESPKITVSEFHFSTDIAKRLFIRVGKQLLSWGAAYFWSPTDFINLERDQASVLAPVDIRSGKPGLRFFIPLKIINILTFTDFSDITLNKEARSIPEHIGQAWRLDATISGVNIGTVGYVAKNKPVKIGVDASGNWFGTDIYTEAALTADYVDAGRRTTSVCLGASRYFGKEKNWLARTEFYFNDTGFEDVNLFGIKPGEFIPLYSGKYYMYGELNATKLASDMLDITLFGCVNLGDRSYSPGIQCMIDLPRVVPFFLFCRYFGGKSNREFTAPYYGHAFSEGLRVMVSL